MDQTKNYLTMIYWEGTRIRGEHWQLRASVSLANVHSVSE